MDTGVGIVVLAFSFAGLVVAFVGAAHKDGQEDEAVQRRLGVRRRTRLGR